MTTGNARPERGIVEVGLSIYWIFCVNYPLLMSELSAFLSSS